MQYPVLNIDPVLSKITETRAKIPILLKGDWHVPDYGLLQVTDDYIDKLIGNFKSNVLGFKPYATLGHLTDSPDPESIDGERKRGDLEEIIKEGDVVYGLYNINSETYNLIKNGDYEYSSPEIQQNFKNKSTGEFTGPTLIRTALTNAPFMPFNESKIVALSQGSNNTSAPICIKLSTNMQPTEELVTNTETKNLPVIEDTTKDIIDNNINSIVEKTVVEDIKEVILEVIDNPSTTTLLPIQEELKEITNMPTLNEVNTSVSTTPATEQKSGLDFEAILAKSLEIQNNLSATVESLTVKFNENIEAISNKTTEAVNAIGTKVEELTNQVTAIASKTDKVEDHGQFITALSTNMRTKELDSRLNELFLAGVTPAALTAAKNIITNVDTNSSLIKLSVNGAEKNVSLEDAVIDLIKLSSNVSPSSERIGSQTTVKPTSYIDNLIESNKNKALKK